jgi:hypothetical protein
VDSRGDTSSVSSRIAVRIIVVAVALAIAIVRFVAIDASSRSNSDTIRPWSIEIVVIAVVAFLVVRAIDRALDRSPC